jgi:ubiquinone/menaquinone biosynthesis C-methylase UbiE
VAFYSQVVFPRLCDFLLDRPPIAVQRRELLAEARGSVLEIGFGSGLNLPHYPGSVRELTTVDPSSGMHRLAQRRLRRASEQLRRQMRVDQRTLSGEDLPFADATFDVVVSTFTLCTIDDVSQALAEAFRVLRPAAGFFSWNTG